MFKALTIVLAFLVFAYECEGALFFYHVPKSEVSNSNLFYSTVMKLFFVWKELKNVPIPNKDSLWEEMSTLLGRLLTTKSSRLDLEAMLNKKPICRMNDITRRFSCMPIIPINIRRLQRLQRLQRINKWNIKTWNKFIYYPTYLLI